MTFLPSLLVAIVIAAPPAALLSRQHFDRARKAFAQRDYRHALEDFTQAAETAPSDLPDLWFDIAQCHRNLGHARQAVLAFEHYLALKPDASDRAKVEAMIVQLGGTPPAADPAPAPAAPAPAETASAAAAEPGPSLMPSLAEANAPAPATPIAAPAATATPANALVASAPPPPLKPHRRRWVVWTSVAGAVAVSALAVGLGVGLGLDNHNGASPPSNPFQGTAGTFDTRGR